MYDLSTCGLPLVDKPFSEIPPEYGAISVLDRNGDLKVIWDKSKPVEVEAARKTFNDLIGKQYLAFDVKDAKGEKGEQIREFDPEVGRLIFSPVMVGG